MTNSTMLWTIIALVAAVAVILAIVGTRRRARVRSAELRRKFGREYDRTVDVYGNPARAERELAARARRVERLRFKDLSDADRVRFAATWDRIQAEFVDTPATAVAAANELIKEVMLARGYPAEGFEQRVEDLSVEHPTVIDHYRAARALFDANRDEQMNTEELRQAVVHYRFLFADLLQEHGAPAVAYDAPESAQARPGGSEHITQH